MGKNSYGTPNVRTTNDHLPLPVALFLIGLVIPLFVYLGPLRLSVYRIVLLFLFFPALYVLLSGGAGKLRTPDVCIILICIWSSISYFALNGIEPMVETVGIFWIETLGAYLVGRCFIRTQAAFRSMISLLYGITIAVAPFAVFELLTGQNIILEAFDKIGNTYVVQDKEQRLGLNRVQGPFSHPIHFGVFFGSLVGFVFYVSGIKTAMIIRYLRAILAAGIGMCALSSGPMAGIMAQLYLIAWDRLFRAFRSRWYVLIALSIFGYALVDVLSNRTPFEVFISYFALNGGTAYARILVWIWGTKSIFEHPFLGIGLSGDWDRPYWLNSSSVDMFWIVPGMRHGVLAWVLWFILFFSVTIPIALKKELIEKVHWYRVGYLCSMFGFFMSGWTVHFWDSIYSSFIFFLASGVWFLDCEGDDPDRLSNESLREYQDKRPHYTRFPSKIDRNQ